MTAPVGTYSFLPWLRQGVASSITAADGDSAVKLRASLQVELAVTGTPVTGTATLHETVSRTVQLFGPGDVIGIEAKAIIRTEPRNWITNFEPNYLPAIEFYDEDFPWRYTPAAPDGTRLRLRPWIALVVLAEGEFQEGKNTLGRPLPYIEVADPALFPPAADLWAWAHVHVNRTLAGSESEFFSSDMDAVLPRLAATLGENPDLAYSRIVSPRRLAEKTRYHAFLVPVFESGRLAGLNRDPATAPHATASAWEPYGTRDESTFYPVYYRWSFHTGAQGDFESLVRLLEAKPVNPRVGVRDMDVLHPGSNIPPIDDADLGGVLKLGGALRVPPLSLDPDDRAEVERYEKWAEPPPPQHPFVTAMANFVNLPDDYEARSAAEANQDSGLGAAVTGNRDPLLTAPLYGQWHALTSRLLRDRDGNPVSQPSNWVHELNLDPRFRVAAAFGTRVVQQSQEDYMRAAWQQIGDVLEANRRIREAQLAREVSWTWHARHLAPLAAVSPERALTLTAPAHRHVLFEGRTMHHVRGGSRVTPAITSVAARRITRPGGRMMRTLPFDADRSPGNLLARINAGDVSAAPPLVTPPALPTVDQVAGQVAPAGLPAWLRRWIVSRWLPWLLIALAVLFVLIAVVALNGVARTVVLMLAALLVVIALLVRGWARAEHAARGMRETELTPAVVDALPDSPGFTLTEPGSGVVAAPGSSDSAVATRFKAALRDWATLRAAGVKVAAPPPIASLTPTDLSTTAVHAVNPTVTIPRRIARGIRVPERLLRNLGSAPLADAFHEIMAYPEIDVPMYKPLTDISSEFFLPNLNLIPPNSITLLETNQRFIEAYMVGVNHEFSRELLWREYPTDQRGSCFRQFWDVRGVLPDTSITAEALKEKLRDIPPIHRWDRASRLGQHDNREAAAASEEEVVLVVRGELLKKYPTAVIYAQAAKWQRREDGSIDPALERELVDITPAEEAAPPAAKLLLPLYEAKVEPDIYFFGFDLTSDKVIGGTGEQPDDPPGWFFVIRERPGEPRFGFDLSREGPIQTMNDIAWDDAVPGGAPGSYVAAGSLGAINLQPLGASDMEKKPQRDDDVIANAAPVSAARWAYVLYQAPMMVAVHGAEMLRR